MKHRSIHIFILLAAVLVAAPQASQELSALKSAVGQRVKAEIFNAFLNFQAGQATRPAQPAPDTLLASGDAPAATKRAGQSRPATQVEVHARREVPAEVAMIGEPTVFEVAQLSPEPPAAPAAPAAYHFEAPEVKEFRGVELAMLTSPAADLARPHPAAARREAAESRRAAAQRRRAAELKNEAASVSARFEDVIKLRDFPEAEIVTQLDALRQVSVELNSAAVPRTWTKVVKVKRAPKPAAAPPPPPARQSCPTRQVACGPNGPENVFFGE